MNSEEFIKSYADANGLKNISALRDLVNTDKIGMHIGGKYYLNITEKERVDMAYGKIPQSLK